MSYLFFLINYVKCLDNYASYSKHLVVLGLIFSFGVLTSCISNDEPVGGRLPMVVTQWDDESDGDILRWFEHSGDTEPLVQETTDVPRIGDDFPIPRAMAAKMLSLAYTDPQTIESWARYPTINYVDVSPDSWYFKYINAAYILGQMSGDGTSFRPNEMLTLNEARLLMRALNPDGPGLLVTDDNRNQSISYALWVDLFVQYLSNMEDTGVIETTQAIPIAHNANTETVITTTGQFSSLGINMSIYLDQEIKLLHRDYEIIALLGQISATPTLQNVLVVNSDTIGLTIFSGGATRNFLYGDDVTPLDETAIIADITISGGEVISAVPSETVIRGTIEQVGSRSIILQQWGAVPIRTPFAVYSHTDWPQARSAADLIVGANIADFHITDGAIGAAVITNAASATDIRVVIGTSNFAGLVHESVQITSTGPFTVRGSDVINRFTGNEVFSVSAQENIDLIGSNRVYIQPDDPTDRLEIVGLERNHENPRYRGTIEIAHANGGFVIVNELPLEEYLYAVVPSEMPTYYGLYAAKVQAITARSFAIHQFYENRFRAFGAHVDDSVISQVYNNIPENDTSQEAVRATAGLVLSYNGEIVLANYFSTSSGSTANFGEVWASGSTFPTHTPTHLTSGLQMDIGEITDSALRNAAKDLSIEENAKLFFQATDLPAFEQHLPWFRWQVRMTADELASSINASLASRQQANPSMIHTLDVAGASTGRPANNIGRLTNLEITRRGQGGNVMEMIMSGSEGKVRVQTEFNIRSLLAPRAATITRIDGSQVNGLNLMPSGFFAMDIEKDANGTLIAVVFYGGGHGHGVGMSQNGAHVLLSQGMSYKDVLRHYYPGVVIVPMQEIQ